MRTDKVIVCCGVELHPLTRRGGGLKIVVYWSELTRLLASIVLGVGRSFGSSGFGSNTVLCYNELYRRVRGTGTCYGG